MHIETGKMANRSVRQDPKLNERIAAIRENNARLENRHKVPLILITPHPQEIELDKKRAVETGSSILPSQIRVIALDICIFKKLGYNLPARH